MNNNMSKDFLTASEVNSRVGGGSGSNFLTYGELKNISTINKTKLKQYFTDSGIAENDNSFITDDYIEKSSGSSGTTGSYIVPALEVYIPRTDWSICLSVSCTQTGGTFELVDSKPGWKQVRETSDGLFCGSIYIFGSKTGTFTGNIKLTFTESPNASYNKGFRVIYKGSQYFNQTTSGNCTIPLDNVSISTAS